ncbi:MAG: flagellar export protein FliJ [Candidatus Omnitrophica bacterium]|nr:flagellar export protein FliJ [Candidatus Omnitrophota bacterium]
MIRFRFRLQRVLELRTRKEEEKERELAHLKTMLREAEEFLEELKDQSFRVSQQIGSLHDNDSRSLDIQELLRYYDYLEYVRNMIVDQIDAIKTIIINLDRKREELIEASKERKIIEKLKDTQYKKFREFVNQWENRFIDEMGTINFNYRKNQEERR